MVPPIVHWPKLHVLMYIYRGTPPVWSLLLCAGLRCMCNGACIPVAGPGHLISIMVL